MELSADFLVSCPKFGLQTEMQQDLSKKFCFSGISVSALTLLVGTGDAVGKLLWAGQVGGAERLAESPSGHVERDRGGKLSVASSIVQVDSRNTDRLTTCLVAHLVRRFFFLA